MYKVMIDITSDLQTSCFPFYYLFFGPVDWDIKAGKLHDENVGELLRARLPVNLRIDFLI